MAERTLLLVDDEENILSSLARLLRRDGYRILRATSGREGLELLAANEVGVIISDQRMPEMSGTEFLSQVKELYPDTIRIVLSGYTELNSITDAINRGAIYKFLTKPWEDELLRANIEEAFRSHEMKRENLRLTDELKSANQALSELNRDLEQRVEDKTQEVVRNLNVLRISQEILDYLPVAVIGIDGEGMIAVANHVANEIFARPGEWGLLGEMAAARIPESLLGGIARKECGLEATKRNSSLDDGTECNYWCYTMGATSTARGWVLVIDANQLVGKGG
ncbi:MAG: response regulator [Gammaproteobacteria bacterium]|nr:response regulator [Gammaproteobacteria bacterium]MBU1646095.1 response regulator [Gammaproteobacteria bacterium]MBU1972157.1 response regulator [Gammaproteobacteria bacterium]